MKRKEKRPGIVSGKFNRLVLERLVFLWSPVSIEKEIRRTKDLKGKGHGGYLK